MKYKTTQKDRYGNMRSLEIETEGNNLEVPPMGSGIPQYEAVGGLAENHPGDPKGSDTVPAWLTPGEFVVNKEAVDIYGPQIKKMNDVGRDIQDGDMNPNQAPPVYADAGVAIPVARPSKEIVNTIKFKNQRSKQIDIYNHLKNNYPQLTDNAIAGIMGNIGVETGYTYDYKTRQNENTGKDMGPGEGLLQFDWHRPYYKKWLNTNDRSDSMASQLDYFMQSIFTKDAVPHPKDKSGFAVGVGNVKELQESLTSNNSPGDIATTITKLFENPKEGSEHYDRRIDTSQEIKGLIDKEAFEPGFGVPQPFKHLFGKNNPGVQDDKGNWHYDTSSIGGETQTDNPSPPPQHLGGALMDTAQESISSIGSTIKNRAGDTINWLGKNVVPVINTITNPYEQVIRQEQGGPVYARKGMQMPGLHYNEDGSKRTVAWYDDPNITLWPPWNNEEEKINPVPVDYGSAWNPFDTTYKYPVDYPSDWLEYSDRHPGAGGMGVEEMVPDIPVSDWNADPNKLNPPVVQGDVQEIEDVVDSGFNPWDYEAAMTYKYPVDYPEVTSAQSVPVPSGVDHGFQKELDKKILQNVDSFTPNPNLAGNFSPDQRIVDPNVMKNVPKFEEFVGNLYEGYGQGAIPRTYDQIVQKEIAGSPVPDIDTLNDIPPGPFTGELGADEEDRAPLIPPMPGEEITVDDRREDYRPSGFVPTMAEASADMIGESLELGNIAELEAAYEDAMNIAILSNEDDPDYEAKQAYVKKAKEKLDAAKSGHKILAAYRDVAPQFGGEPQWIKDAEIRNLIADEQATIDELKARLNDPSLPEEYKEAIKGRIAKIQESIDAKAAEVQIESQNKLAELGSKIDNATEAEIKSKLDSEQGQKVLDEKENKDDNDPEVSKTRQMFDFLFGDLIDGGEIGRAIAVYLASRALGYNHDGSIGFVAKQYLKRVDAKNAQMDKWILANAGKYDKASLAKFKKTKDPNDLIPLGASPRSTGRKEMQYHKELGQMMAYEFKVKNAAGDDITYWSFDINGLKPELRVGSGWSDENVIDVSIDEINAVKDVITGVHLGKDKHTTGSEKNRKTVYRSGRGSMPGIIPESVAGETAQWLFDRGIPPGKFLQPIDDAYTALIAANQKLLEEDEDAVLHSSLIPFLEDATIKLRLENMMYKDKDGKMRPLPSPIKATVDGKERTMTNEDLVRIQQRIESVYTTAKSDIFWAEIAAQWKEEAHEDFQKKYQKKDGKKLTWREVFMEMAKEKDNAAYTPFGLFAESIIENEIADIGKSLQP